MMISDRRAAGRFHLLTERGVLTAAELGSAEDTAAARGITLERVLLREYGISRNTLLQALSEYYRCPSVEYDERMPVPPEILEGLDGERLSITQWFPIIRDGDTVVIAANDPADPAVIDEVRNFIKAERYEFWLALGDDIQWFIQDFLHARPGYLIGTERTGLAFWRNTMAHWRTRLAGYRTELAKGRTSLGLLRWGLGIVALSDALIHMHKNISALYLDWIMMAAGFSLSLFGLSGYLRIRRSGMKPPEHQTLVEVTSATLYFLENYHFIEQTGIVPAKQTMLARLGDFLSSHCTILYPSPSSRVRTHLARERNVLAGQRTVAACYRTIYARARTGLAFIRTGVSFSSLGLGLMHYFGFSMLTAFDSLLVVAGIFMAADGVLWYMPVRKEQSEVPRCPVPQ